MLCVRWLPSNLVIAFLKEERLSRMFFRHEPEQGSYFSIHHSLSVRRNDTILIKVKFS